MDEICLLNTMLIKTDGSKMLFPNIAMASQGIINIARSGLHGEFFFVRPPHPTLRQTRIPNSVPAACCMRHPLQPQCLGLSAANDHMNPLPWASAEIQPVNAHAMTLRAFQPHCLGRPVSDRLLQQHALALGGSLHCT